MTQSERGSVLYEFQIHGAVVKVSALDPVTGLEVCIQAPRATSRAHMMNVAAAKLQRRLREAASNPGDLEQHVTA